MCGRPSLAHKTEAGREPRAGTIPFRARKSIAQSRQTALAEGVGEKGALLLLPLAAEGFAQIGYDSSNVVIR